MFTVYYRDDKMNRMLLNNFHDYEQALFDYNKLLYSLREISYISLVHGWSSDEIELYEDDITKLRKLAGRKIKKAISELREM